MNGFSLGMIVGQLYLAVVMLGIDYLKERNHRRKQESMTQDLCKQIQEITQEKPQSCELYSIDEELPAFENVVAFQKRSTT